MKSVQQFTSYRKFLKSILTSPHSSSQPMSLTSLAKKLGMSVSALQMVLSGQRNLTLHKAHSFAEALGLVADEEEYFLALVHFEQAQSPHEKSFYKRKLKLKETIKPASIVRTSHSDLLAQWYLPSLLVAFIDSKGEPDFSKLGQKIGIADTVVRSIFTRLLKLGILEKSNDEQQVHIVFDKLAPTFQKEQFLARLLSEVQRRLKTDFRSQQSYFEAHTVNMCERRFQDFVKDYKELLNAYIAVGPQSPNHVIYQSLFAFIRAI